MVLSLTVYTVTALLMAWLGWHVSTREQRLIAGGGSQLPFLSWEIVAAICIYVLVSAVRWQTSWDYNQYLSYYMSIQSLGEYSRENYEPGFHLISVAMARSGLHFAWFFGFWAAVHIILLYYALRHRKFLLPWVALCILLGPYYMQWMSILRQAVVECLFVAMIELIIRRKFWLYLLVTALACTVHRMSVLFLPFYFVPLIPVRQSMRRWLPAVALVVCVLAGSFPQWIQWLFDQVGQWAQLLGYERYYRLFSNDVAGYGFRYVMGPVRLCPLLLGGMLIWYYPQMHQHFAGTDPGFTAFYRFSIVYLCYANLMANTTQYLTRPGDLLRAVFMVTVCYLMAYLYRERRWLPLVAACALTFYYIYYELFKAVTMPGSIYAPEVYHTFLF